MFQVNVRSSLTHYQEVDHQTEQGADHQQPEGPLDVAPNHFQHFVQQAALAGPEEGTAGGGRGQGRLGAGLPEVEALPMIVAAVQGGGRW